MHDDDLGPWVLGTVMALLGLLGLVMARNAHDAIFEGTGLALSAFSVLFIFALINRYVGR